MSVDPSTIWADFGWFLQPDGTRRLLSWNAATKELKLWALNPNRQQDMILAIIDTEDEVRRRLDGWQDHNDTKEGLSWLSQRLEGCR
jgi:hypothetical protein